MKTKRPMAETIRRAILKCGITRYEISKRTGVNQAVLCRFMKGEKDLVLVTVEQLAPVLGLKLTCEPKRRAKP